MRWFYFFVLLLVVSSPVFAEDNLFNSGRAIRQEACRLGEEAAETAITPVKRESLPGTVAVAGAVGLLYYFDDDIRSKVAGVKGKALDDATDVGSFVGSPYLHLGVAALVYGGGRRGGVRKISQPG